MAQKTIEPRRSAEVLIDGECALCRSFAGLLKRLDAKGRVTIVPFPARQPCACSSAGEAPGDPAAAPPLSIQLRIGERKWFASDAVLRIFCLLGFPWNLTFLGFLLPVRLRDAIYFAVARRRYKWFGRASGCQAENCAKEKPRTSAGDAV